MVSTAHPKDPPVAVVQASEFKAKCLALMDDVAATGRPLVITKNGQPVAELHPYQGAREDSPFGRHPGVRLVGDIIGPAVPAEEWEASR
jgi:prevent-host-death family protein